MTSFEVPDDPIALSMENRLLTIEVEHLRGRVAALGDDADEDDTRSSTSSATVSDEVVVRLREEVEELRKARSDLRWLLQRLGGSPAGPLLRRFSGFTALERRWLD